MIVFRRNNQRGDTIVEVLLSMAVLAIVASAAYATSTRSFHAGLDAQEREQAVTIAGQQVEMIKNADAAGAIGTFKTSGSSQNGNYTVKRSFDANTKVFTVTVSWTSMENRPQQTVLYYRASNSYVP